MARSSSRDADGHIDFLGFAPDLDQNTPGACQVMEGVIPTLKGFRAAPSADTTQRFLPLAASALHDATVIAGFYMQNRSMFVIGKNRIWQHQHSTTAVDVSGSVTASATSETYPMSMVEFGNQAYVASHDVTLAYQPSSGTAFQSITGAPVASFLVAADRFVLAFRGDGFNDSWRCSARDNGLSWTASPAFLATQGRLPDDDAYGIKAVNTIGNEVLLFKSHTTYRGRFIPNNAEVWVWEKLSINTGAIYGYTTARYRQGLVFLSNDNLYYYDGANLQGLMDERLALWYAERVLSDQTRAFVVVDEMRDLVWISTLMYDDESSTTYNRMTLIVHPPTKRWTKWNSNGLKSLVSAPSIWPGAWASTVSRGDLRRVWGIRNFDVIADQMPRELAADATATATATITTNDFGNAFLDAELSRASLKFTSAPAAATVTHYSRNSLDATLETRGTIARSADGLFDVRQNARWHRLQFNLTGDFELNGYAPELQDTGKR